MPLADEEFALLTQLRRLGLDALASGSVEFYFAYTKWPRRFCCQQLSFDSVQNGFSFP